MIGKTIAITSISMGVSLLFAASAFAASNPAGNGQPGTPTVNCGVGNASAEPNGFSTLGFSNATAHYAGTPGTPSYNNAHSSKAVAQYDIACYQQTQNH